MSGTLFQTSDFRFFYCCQKKKNCVLVTVVDLGRARYLMFAYRDCYSFCLDFCTRLSGFLSTVMCIFYSGNKAPPRAFSICLGETVMVTAKPKPVLPEKLVDQYPGPFGHWVRPRNHHSMAITERKSNNWQRVTSHGCPARDVISNVQKGAHAVIRNCVRHIPGVYKRLHPNLGESFCSYGHRST